MNSRYADPGFSRLLGAAPHRGTGHGWTRHAPDWLFEAVSGQAFPHLLNRFAFRPAITGRGCRPVAAFADACEVSRTWLVVDHLFIYEKTSRARLFPVRLPCPASGGALGDRKSVV